jgi:hypothetical protein
MRLKEAIDTLSTGDASRVYGQPYETVDGVTIIPVARVRGRIRPGKRDADAAAQDQLRVTATPVGVFVIKDGKATWEPAVDATRIALMGELIGLVAAGLATVAMVRRPPWPDLARFVSRPQ